MLDFYADTIFNPQRLDKVLSKYSKCSISVGEIEDQYEELMKYLESLLEETIAERVKLERQKMGLVIKILTPNNISANKSWK